jgi:hypothetical protein
VLHLLNLEEIEALLLKVPALVKQFEERDPDFFPAVKSWLAGAEDTLSKNRMPQTSEIAVCRGALISVERGFSDGAALQSRMGARNLREARASHVLKRATDVITETIRSRRGQLDEASRVMMQIVAVADHLGLIPADSGQNHTAYLQGILQAISNRPELASLVVHVTGLLGKADTLIVLDRAIASFRQ